MSQMRHTARLLHKRQLGLCSCQGRSTTAQSSGYRTCTQGMKDNSQLDEKTDMVSLMNGLSSVSFKACS